MYPRQGIHQSSKTEVSLLVREYLLHCKLIERHADKTINNRKYVLTPFFRDLGITFAEDITLYDVDRYFMDHQELAVSSVTTSRRNVRLFFQWCYEYREIQLLFNYAAIKTKKYKPQKKRILTREEVMGVVSTTQHIQDRLIISLMFETGMRIGELLNLQTIDISGVSISIRGKGEKDRIVVMPHDLARAIREYAADRDVGHVFRPLQRQKGMPDRYVSDYGVRGRIQREFMRHGIKMHPHLLRHSFAVDWLQRGGDIRTLQLLLGHESIETTQWYLQLSDQHLISNYLANRSESVMYKSIDNLS